MQLHRHVAIPQVIGRLQEGQGVSAANLHHRLRRRLDLHPPVTVVANQAIPGLQSRATGKLQNEITATATAAMAPQARALISRQGQLQGRDPGLGQRSLGVTLHQDDR